MATEIKKMKDPTEAALSAIEQALNLDEHSLAKETPKADPVTGEKIDDPKLPDVDDHDFTTGPFRDLDHEAQRREPSLAVGEDGRPSYVAPDRAAVANDDRQNVGMMLQALQVRPSRRAYFFATVVSLLWLGGLGALVYSQGITTPETLLAAFSPIQLAIGGFVLFAPVILFFIAAMLAVRSQEMRLVARAVGEVAVRLAQPESFSTDAVLSVSQAVRREVAAVGDGVERALARAGELETLVRSEISTLERAYTDNEIRIRSLIDELVAQREAIVNNAERVRSAINGSHQNLTQDLDAAAQRVAAAVHGAGEQVTVALDQRGEQITQALGRAGERVIEEMAVRGVELVDRLTGASTDIKSGIADAGTSNHDLARGEGGLHQWSLRTDRRSPDAPSAGRCLAGDEDACGDGSRSHRRADASGRRRARRFRDDRPDARREPGAPGRGADREACGDRGRHRRRYLCPHSRAARPDLHGWKCRDRRNPRARHDLARAT